MVVVEAVTLIGRALGSQAAAEVGRLILNSPSLTVLRRTASDDEESLDAVERYGALKIGMADCVSFTLMKRARLTRAFTFDRRHFGAAGFDLLPR